MANDETRPESIAAPALGCIKGTTQAINPPIERVDDLLTNLEQAVATAHNGT